MVGSRIIVQKLAADQVTAGGLHLPDSAKRRLSRGLVIACPDTFTESGAVIKTPFGPTDIVVYHEKSAAPMDHDPSMFIVEMSAVVYAE